MELKAEIIKHIEDDLNYQEERCNVVAMSQAETVENHTRRDNIRIIDVQEASEHTGNRSVPEKDSVNIWKVIDAEAAIGVELDENEISNAHRLPSEKVVEWYIISRFTRRTVKTQRLRNRKKPAKFLAKMKMDPRIESVWTRENTTFFQKKENKTDNPKLQVITGYQKVASKVRDSKGGSVMIQLTSNCSIQEELDCLIQESLFATIEKPFSSSG